MVENPIENVENGEKKVCTNHKVSHCRDIESINCEKLDFLTQSLIFGSEAAVVCLRLLEQNVNTPFDLRSEKVLTKVQTLVYPGHNLRHLINVHNIHSKAIDIIFINVPTSYTTSHTLREINLRVSKILPKNPYFKRISPVIYIGKPRNLITRSPKIYIETKKLRTQPAISQRTLPIERLKTHSRQKPNRRTLKEARSIRILIQIEHTLKVFKDFRHIERITFDHLIRSFDVETNPGPSQSQGSTRQATSQPHSQNALQVVTYNVRGISDESKLRHLLNYFYKGFMNKNRDFICALQETYVINEGKIPYLWRGNYHVTSGTGHGCGCVTLLSPHLSVVAYQNIDNRGHVLVCQRSDSVVASYVVANIYAPNPNTADKIDFYKKVFEVVAEFEERFDCTNTLIMGDFNLTFNTWERKNRLYSTQEKRVAQEVNDLVNEAGLKDIWIDNKGFTWNRPNTDCFSTLDRILYNPGLLKAEITKVNWGLSTSDHAAVEVGFNFVEIEARPRSKITRLDPSILQDPAVKVRIETEINEMFLGAAIDWNPHMKLEFLKVCIRTVIEKSQAERKKRERSEEDSINEELDTAVEKVSSGQLSTESKNNLLSYIEELRAKKSVLIERKGKRLAEKLGTKWYNEGEKSTRYFLRLLKRTMPDDFKKIEKPDGTLVTESREIDKEIISYYKELYENGPPISVTDDDTFFNQIESISGQEEDELVKEIGMEELRISLHSSKDSAPGPDGIPYSIIGSLWSIYGPILTEAWRYSLAIGKLPPSHRTSYLKLIPKAGKDLGKLTNWRPISLSNCDHKLITKVYAKRLAEKVATKIKDRQTAYIKGRLINDNIRSILATINLANSEENLKGLIVSLDAKKAFDSVDHSYIEKCLIKFGCERFVPIFRTLYNELQTDIIINGRINVGFLVRRGVKQGDSLSCILFIMCMEPLLRNIEANDRIRPMFSSSLQCALPKTYAYADDVNATIEDNLLGVKALFQEYERLTKVSGLELNADKTELLKIGSVGEEIYSVNYMDKRHDIKSCVEVKINGILFQNSVDSTRRSNVEAVLGKMDRQFRTWSRRSLTTLGKILIVKCFGISQLTFLMQSMALDLLDFKKFNALIYKYIWNRHYSASKAPERIKRTIVNTPVKLGGLGMLDVEELDASLKLRALGRLMDSTHPFLTILRTRLNLDCFFEPCIDTRADSVTNKAVELLKLDRNKLWLDVKLNSSRELIAAIRELSLKKLVTVKGYNSLAFFNIWHRGARKLKDLNDTDLRRLEVHIPTPKLEKCKLAIRLRVPNHAGELIKSIMIEKKFKPLSKCTSKEIRESRSNRTPILEYKLGLQLSISNALNWGQKISKLTSTRHKNIVIRVAHGDIYTKDKLHRFGMEPSNICPRCDQVEDLRHKYIDCHYVQRIWSEMKKFDRRLVGDIPSANELDKYILGAFTNSNKAFLTLAAEILNRITGLKSDTNYLVHPKAVLAYAIKALATNETEDKMREIYSSLLNQD